LRPATLDAACAGILYSLFAFPSGERPFAEPAGERVDRRNRVAELVDCGLGLREILTLIGRCYCLSAG